MYLTRHQTAEGARWALDGQALPRLFNLGLLLNLPAEAVQDLLEACASAETVDGQLLAPVEPFHEVWASGVTYTRSRQAREAESSVSDVYARVYDAPRPELFFKAVGWRVKGHEAPVRIREDSRWNVPEPEMVLVINRESEIVGYCAGNDMSSRDIEGENPLYLPQAKVYDGSCAVGPGILLARAEALRDLPVEMDILRDGEQVFHGETSVSRMKRRLEELAEYLGRELGFPQGVFLMTGTGIVPPEDFSLQPGDTVRIGVGALTLQNWVEC